MQIGKLAHVALGGGGDLPRFYEELFGLVRVAEQNGISFWSTGRGAGYDVAFGPWPTGLDHFALEVRDAETLSEAQRCLEEAGAEVAAVDLDREHAVAAGICFTLPSGHVVELVLPAAPEVYRSVPLVPGRHHRGIGPVELEHVTMTCGDVERTATFLIEALGLRLTESVQPRPGEWFNAFLRARDRHHDLAFFPSEEGDVPGLNHVCFAVPSVDRIVQVCDLLVERGIFLDSSLGRHLAGNNVFVYFKDPAGHRIEVNTQMAEVHVAAEPRILPEMRFDGWRQGIPPAMRSTTPCRDGRAVAAGTR
jgi:catechol 2,3-dioxygenase-like lactoylglutathione lyase family enzyme